jgi:hypothetical protein
MSNAARRFLTKRRKALPHKTPQGASSQNAARRFLTKRRKALRKGTTITTDLINYINQN